MNLSVSVVIPAYNAADTIGLCIESLLKQSYPKNLVEILVVDNKSTDNTAELIKKYPVTYISQTDKQQRAATRNAGIIQARNDIIALIDSDCIADPDWLKNGLRWFTQENIGGVGGHIAVYEAHNWIEKHIARTGAFGQGITEERLQRKCAKIATANAFYRGTLFREQKILFNENPEVANEDLDLSYRILRQTDVTFVYDVQAIVYHKHSANLKGLLEQYYRYGFSNIMTYKTFYPEVLDEIKGYGYLKPFYWTMLGLLKNKTVPAITDFFRYLVSPREERKITAIDSFLFLCRNAAFSWGQLRAARYFKTPFADVIIPENKRAPN